jgi:chromate transport protein ChrA
MSTNVNMKFTDQNLKLFYGNVLSHYKTCIDKKYSIEQTLEEMILSVQYALEAEDGTLFHLDQEEKNKVYTAFYAIWNALPQDSYKPQPTPLFPKFNVTKIKVVHYHHRYNCYDPILFDWMLVYAIMNDCHYHHGGYFPNPGGGIPGGVHHHGSRDDDLAKALIALLVITVAAIALVLATIALYFMLSQFAESIDRFCYDEGWLKAAWTIAIGIGFGASTVPLYMAFVAPGLISLAIMAGFNPIAVAVTGIVLLSIISAGLGGLAMNVVYGEIEKNKDAIDPEDPKRFALSAENEENLIAKGINPTVVRCALSAIRVEIARISDKGPIPPILTRFFTSSSEMHDLLKKARQLRFGQIDEVKVGGLHFHCVMPDYTSQQDLPELPTYTSEPSAPPMYAF